MSRLKIGEFEEKGNATIEFLKQEIKKIRSGRANPNLIEDITVEAYGEKQPLKNLANINVADASLLTVQPWDKSLVKTIEKALQENNIGINPIVSGDMIRLPLPSLTEEQRMQYVKVMKDFLEEARIAIRALRKDVIVGLESAKKDGELPEDEVTRLEKELQKMVEKMNMQIDEIGIIKEKELMSI